LINFYEILEEVGHGTIVQILERIWVHEILSYQYFTFTDCWDSHTDICKYHSCL